MMTNGEDSPGLERSPLARLRCDHCGEYVNGPYFSTCPACRTGPIGTDLALGGTFPALLARPASVWHYADRLPVVPTEYRYTLGEGGSPLIGASFEGIPYLIKNEGVNPTHSFKDRFSAVNVSACKALGYSRLVLSSTGNAGLAAAAFGALASIETRVVCHPNTPSQIQSAITALGAELLVLPYREHQKLVAMSIQDGYFPGSRGYPFEGVTPYGVEGYKTIAYEIAAAVGRAPDIVYVPLGGGDGLHGIHKGFRDLVSVFPTYGMPRIVGVETRSRVALSIGRDEHGPHGIAAIARSGGYAISVTTSEIRTAMRQLAKRGILAEPSSAVSVAGFLRDVSSGDYHPGEIAVCVVTSSLLKWIG